MDSSQPSASDNKFKDVCHSEDCPLISPCFCSGSLRYVHNSCLQELINSSGTNYCELCKFQFIMKNKFLSFWKWKRIKLTFVEKLLLVLSLVFHAVTLPSLVCLLVWMEEKEDFDRKLLSDGGRIIQRSLKTIFAIGLFLEISFIAYQCRLCAQLFLRWRNYNRIIYVQNALEKQEQQQPATHLEKIEQLENSDDEEMVATYEDAVSTAMEDFSEFTNPSETDELEKETMVKKIVLPFGLNCESGNCVRNKRSVQEDVPDICEDASFDTVTRIQNGGTYVFKGDFYWKLGHNGITEGYPRSISTDWDGLPGNLDASFTFSNGKTYFFKGSQYWRFVNKNMDQGYPKQISERFPGIPDDLDAAFVWSGDGKIYFFKGTEYWRFDFTIDPAVDPSYPQLISRKWSPLLANGIDAAFHWQDNHIYFFKGDKYYRYNGETCTVEVANPPYPRSTATGWLGCR